MKKKHIIIIISVIFLGVLHAALSFTGLPRQTLFSSAYVFICVYWMHSIQRRFFDIRIKTYLTLTALLLIFLSTVQFIKYVFVWSQPLTSYLWYTYYVPFTLCPLFMLFAVMQIGQTKKRTPMRFAYLLAVPDAAVVILILTNEFHNLAFRFSTPDRETSYERAPVYYAAVGMIVMITLLIITVLFVKMRGKRFFYRIRYTLVMILLGVSYIICYRLSSPKMIFQIMYELPEFFCLFLIGFWESLVLARVVPTNAEHSSFFRASSIKAGLTDENYDIVLKASNGVSPSPDQIRAAGRSPVYLSDNVLLKSHRVRGGSFYWTEDMSELSRLESELEDTGGYLLEEHALLNEEAKLEELKKRTSEQNRLFDGIAKSLKSQLDTIEEILNSLPDEEPGFCRMMKYAGVLGAYVKRYSNLLLLSDADSRSDSSELFLCINESFIYLRLLDVFCCADIQSGIELPVSYLLLVYNLFEEVLEASSQSVSAVFVRLRGGPHGPVFYIETSSDPVILQKSLYETIESSGFRLRTEYDDGCFFATLTGEEADTL